MHRFDVYNYTIRFGKFTTLRGKKMFKNKKFIKKLILTLIGIMVFSLAFAEIDEESCARLFKESLIEAANKALGNVSEGSRFAIDQVSVSTDGLQCGKYKPNKRIINDQLIEILLNNGYKVVAKDFLEKLKEEHKQQQGGGFNDKTKANRLLSGIGYFLNVRVTVESIRIQVINVSTGEFEGNVTVDVNEVWERIRE